MNILYIDHYAGSQSMGMEFRPYYFAKNWVKAGHSVYIIAGSYSHIRLKNPTNIKNLQVETVDGINYVWIKTVEYKGNGFKRIISVLQFLQTLYKNSKRIAETFCPDVVIASSTYPMDTYPAQKICDYSGAALIHEVHDMWPITPMELYGLKASNPIIKFIQKAEDSFCKNSDMIVSLVPSAEDYYMEHGMQRGHFAHISNGVIKTDWPDEPTVNPDLRNYVSKIRKDYNKVICFFGSHTKSYALDYLIRAADKCRDLSIAYLFVGGGNYKSNLIQLKDQLNLHSVYFLNPIPKDEIPGLLSLVDGIYIGAASNKMFRFGIAMNKLFDSMASGKPIIFAADVPNDYIEEYHCGFSVKAESEDDLVNAIREFDNSTQEELLEMGKKARTICMGKFEYQKLSDDFIVIMKKAISFKTSSSFDDDLLD